MKKMYTVDDINKSINRLRKKEQVKKSVHDKVKKTVDWCNRNKEVIIVLAPVVFGACTALVKGVSKNVNLRKEKQVKDLYCYDRSLGHYWALRRELTNREWVEIDKRKQNGERLADILSELKVLK